MRISTIAGTLIILAALGIAITVVILGGVRAEYKHDKRILEGKLQLLVDAMYKYVPEHDGQAPASLQDLVNGQYIDSVPTNPFTGGKLKLVQAGGWQGPEDVEMTVEIKSYHSHEITSYSATITLTAYTEDSDILAFAVSQVMVPKGAAAPVAD